MVRLVFRPYTQIRRSICTSEPLRASTRVSSGFALFRHSSPSFGSHQTCSTHPLLMQRAADAAKSHHSPSLRTGVFHPNTRMFGGLLGPCFKTGPVVSLLVRSLQGLQRGYGTRGHRPPHLLDLAKTTTDWPPYHCCLAQQLQTPAKTQSASLLTISRSFHSLFKVLFIFPSRYLFAIGLSPVFSLRWYLPPTLVCIPKQTDSAQRLALAYTQSNTGLSPSVMPCSKELVLPLQRKRCLKLQFACQRHEIPKLSCSRFTRRYWGNPG